MRWDLWRNLVLCTHNQDKIPKDHDRIGLPPDFHNLLSKLGARRSESTTRFLIYRSVTRADQSRDFAWHRNWRGASSPVASDQKVNKQDVVPGRSQASLENVAAYFRVHWTFAFVIDLVLGCFNLRMTSQGQQLPSHLLFLISWPCVFLELRGSMWKHTLSEILVGGKARITRKRPDNVTWPSQSAAQDRGGFCPSVVWLAMGVHSKRRKKVHENAGEQRWPEQFFQEKVRGCVSNFKALCGPCSGQIGGCSALGVAVFLPLRGKRSQIKIESQI